jgi:hypothetical protein
MSDTQKDATPHEAQGPGGIYLVELTEAGFRIRHGRGGNYGGGIWSSRPKARLAADDLAAGRTIRETALADRYTYT